MAVQSDRYGAVRWRKSSASPDVGDCVEVARLGSSVLVRDSHDRSGGVLALTFVQWRELLARIRNGELDHGQQLPPSA
jgi:Domain of unknown function (DUF397)